MYVVRGAPWTPLHAIEASYFCIFIWVFDTSVAEVPTHHAKLQKNEQKNKTNTKSKINTWFQIKKTKKKQKQKKKTQHLAGSRGARGARKISESEDRGPQGLCVLRLTGFLASWLLWGLVLSLFFLFVFWK